MSHAEPAPKLKPSRAVRAEAALWLAHLRGPERSPDVEHGFRLWLDAKPEHAVAFEHATELWERTAGVRRHPHERVATWIAPGHRHGWRRATALAAAMAMTAVLSAVWYTQRGTVTTAVGEQRTITLDDGTRIFLNTNTRAAVRYDSRERRVRLDRGEALFEVARQAARPFTVTAGKARIEALGTSFVVRRDSQDVAVTLVDGKVSVLPEGDNGVTAEPQNSKILSPGERLTLAGRSAPALDMPVIDKLIAWQRGQVAFDNVPLSEAVKEMNRYSAVKLSIERPEAARIVIGGVFRTGDAKSFARAMAETYRLDISEKPGTIILAGAPEAPERSSLHPR